MLALIQARFLEHPSERVQLIVASCFSDILRITAPFPPYNDDIMRRIFRLIVGTFRDWDNGAGSTFRRKFKVLEAMAMDRTYEIMFNLECDDLILQMFRCFFSIRKHHPDIIIAHMQSILSSCMGHDETICRKLQTKLLNIWRRKRLVSPAAYELAQGLVEQNIEFLGRQLTREERLQFRRSGSRNELRRKGLCFICKEPWGPDHSCVRDADEVAKVEQVDIPSVCQGEGSSSDESMGSVEDASGEREQPCIDDDDSRPELCSSVQGEQSGDSL